MKILLTTTNESKKTALQASLNVPYFLGQDLEILTCKSDSGVPDMPLTLPELYAGARNRVKNSRRLHSDADYFVGMESGIAITPSSDYSVISVVYIENQHGKGHFGQSTGFEFPRGVQEALLSEETPTLEDVMLGMGAPREKIFSITSCGGELSDNLMNRDEQLRGACVCVWIPFFNIYHKSV